MLVLYIRAKLYHGAAEVKDMPEVNEIERLAARGYRDVVYVDPAGVELTDANALLALLPEWFDPRTDLHFDSLVTRLKDPGDVGAQVWHTASWPAWEQYGLSGMLSLPSVFSMRGVIYIVRTADAITLSSIGEYAVPVDPLVLRLQSGDALANADLLAHVFDVASSDYLFDLQASALRKYPPVSLDLIRAASIDPESISVIEGRKLRGSKPGSTLFRARPLQDLDYVDFDYLIGEDEGRLFLSHLPARATDLKHSYRLLCPLSAVSQDGAVRQGEWWFVPAPIEDMGPHGRPNGAYLRSTGVKVQRLTKRERASLQLSRSRYLGVPEHGYKSTYGGKLARLTSNSEHFAKEVVHGEGGEIWARGWVKHVRHDHEPIQLDCWYRAVINGQVNAWSAPAARRVPKK